MALEDQVLVSWGKDRTYRLGPFTDTDGDDIDLTGATVTWQITQEEGAGTSLVTKTTADDITLTTDDDGKSVADVDIDGSADFASVDPGTYWHQAHADLPSSGPELMLVAPSKFVLKAAK